MCGIAGFMNFNGLSRSGVIQTCKNMAKELEHRGPDDSGIWYDCSAELALVHRRLSILDISSAGHQPMLSRSGRYVIVFNGELYNHFHLRDLLKSDLEGVNLSWVGHSDTETFLAAIEAWGIDKAISSSVGMFAAAIWDRKERKLYLTRDRIGEKPLYYGFIGRIFVFASELKAIRRHPDFTSEVDRGALSSYLRHNYIPAPFSIYKNIKKLLPGTILKLTFRNGATEEEQYDYWSFSKSVNLAKKNITSFTDTDVLSQLHALLQNSVKSQMLSDVPLGAFLSGGIDSSLIVSLMQSLSSSKVKTFSIGFNEKYFNEAPEAAKIAKHLGTDHHELYVTPSQAMNEIQFLPHYYDEPFSDSSQIPTMLISKFASRSVKVALTGDGGDEIFGGYNRYLSTKKYWQFVSYIPSGLKHIFAAALTQIPVNKWNKLYDLNNLISHKGSNVNFGNKIHKGAGLLRSTSLNDVYLKFISHWDQPDEIVIGGKEDLSRLSRFNHEFKYLDPVEAMMAIDTMTYLPDDILVKVDRASMASSLETRVPFLDHRLIEFSWGLPLNFKIRENQNKWILRQILEKYVPSNLFDRPKMGFGVPIDSWLRGPLRDWAEDLLDEKFLRDEGYFHPEPIRELWHQHLRGDRNWQYHIWDILMFQAWLRQSKTIIP